jgi:CheY-like chemotaxis protein
MAYRILIADDEMVLRFLLSETLSDEGFEITEAEDGGQAIDFIQKKEFDLIILDYMMPEKTGVEVCEWLRNQDNPNRQAPVVLLTAKALEKDRERAQAAGVTTYIVKPFSPIQLITTIEQLLQG